jgi:hypothetical protein
VGPVPCSREKVHHSARREQRNQLTEIGGAGAVGPVREYGKLAALLDAMAAASSPTSARGSRNAVNDRLRRKRSGSAEVPSPGSRILILLSFSEK